MLFIEVNILQKEFVKSIKNKKCIDKMWKYVYNKGHKVEQF